MVLHASYARRCVKVIICLRNNNIMYCTNKQMNINYTDARAHRIKHISKLDH